MSRIISPILFRLDTIENAASLTDETHVGDVFNI